MLIPELLGDGAHGQPGEAVAPRYGEHAYDQWTVDELLAPAAQAPSPGRKTAR
ncbi:hypothetical protein ACFQY7_15935 [Actinomadura luteofluorescens]|uniref:Uncharacterized protein n=1 Tax=Actinomadura luteofluorescens TaxID=46163 RepID=A0A7Y9JL06_9ACTN|nr:hypothetical protein [Actinomadura luteofluorescens]NYD52073.1 hypothetical protein [Actinomadura luteofluorescens]